MRVTRAQFNVVTNMDMESSQWTLYELLRRPFKPFSEPYWLALLAALLYAGYALYTLDATGWEDEEEDHAQRLLEDDHGKAPDIAARPPTAYALKQLKWARNPLHAFLPVTHDDVNHLGRALTYALQSFLGGGDFRHEPRSPHAWLVFCGTSFLILVSIANYTGMVTAAVVESSGHPGVIESIEDGVAKVSRAMPVPLITLLPRAAEGRSVRRWCQGVTFCGWEVLRPLLTGPHPGLKYVGFDDPALIVQGMDEGVCEAAIVEAVSWEVARSGAFSSPEVNAKYANHYNGAASYHCDTKILLAGRVTEIDIAFPVREELARILSCVPRAGLDKLNQQRGALDASRGAP